MPPPGSDIPGSGNRKSSSGSKPVFKQYLSSDDPESSRRSQEHSTPKEHSGPWQEVFFEDIENRKRFIRTATRLGARNLAEAQEYADQAMEELFRVRWKVEKPHGWAATAILRIILKAREEERRLRDALLRNIDVVQTPYLPDWDEEQAFQRVCGILDTLPGKQRDVMTLYYDGYAIGEIAKILGLRPGAARNLLCDARKNLQKHPEVRELIRTLFQPSWRVLHADRNPESPPVSTSHRKEKS